MSAAPATVAQAVELGYRRAIEMEGAEPTLTPDEEVNLSDIDKFAEYLDGEVVQSAVTWDGVERNSAEHWELAIRRAEMLQKELSGVIAALYEFCPEAAR